MPEGPNVAPEPSSPAVGIEYECSTCGVLVYAPCEAAPPDDGQCMACHVIERDNLPADVADILRPWVERVEAPPRLPRYGDPKWPTT